MSLLVVRKLLVRVFGIVLVVSLVVGAVVAGGLVDLPGGQSDGSESLDDAPGPVDPGSGPADSSRPFVVGFDSSSADRDIGPVVKEAVSYWNENASEYPAAYEKRLVFRPGAADPDVLVRYELGTSCSGAAAGCAPIPDSKADAEGDEKPLVVQVSALATENRFMAKNTLIHEFGHVLSVSHCEEPSRFMGCQNDEPGPSWEDRRYPFGTSELKVYVENSDAPAEMQATVDDVLEEITTGTVDDLPSDLSVTEVSDPWKAHIHLRVDKCRGCFSGNVISVAGGPPYGGSYSYLEHARVKIVAADSQEAREELLEHLKQVVGNEGKPRR